MQQPICLQGYSAIAIINRELWKVLKAFQVPHKAVIVRSSWLGIPTKLHSTWASLLKQHEEEIRNKLTSNAPAANN